MALQTCYRIVYADTGERVEGAPVAGTLTEALLWIEEHGAAATVRPEPIACGVGPGHSMRVRR